MKNVGGAKNETGLLEDMAKNCFYALGGINYKNGVITVCPRQADQAVYAHETILPSKIFNHRNIKNIRKLLHEDKWPQGCNTCEWMERDNLRSMRLDFLLDHDNVFYKSHGQESKFDNREQAKTKLLDCYDTNTHEVTNEGLRHIEFRFSTACNFTCLHCSKVYSSGWTKMLRNYEPDEEDRQYDLRQLLGTEHRHGPNDKNEMSLTTEQSLKIVEDLNENFPELKYIDFSGGELLYQKQFLPTLKKLSEHPNASNMHISFHSNFNADFSITELSDHLYPFQTSTICISIDAGKTFYPYFRHGGTWEKLQQNIKEFKSYNNFTWLDISCTTSIYQMLDIYDVFESFIDLQCSTDASIVQTPQYLDPSLLMYDFKDDLEKDLRKTEDLIKKNLDNRIEIQFKNGRKYWVDHNLTLKWFQYIEDYVKQTKIKYSHFNRWLIYRKKSDEIWKQNFNDYFQNYQIEDNELIRVK